MTDHDEHQETRTGSPHKFAKTFCSQCGHEFGFGDHGYSRCEDHIRAAAPDLLAALKALTPSDIEDHPNDFMPEWHKARAAINKAEGRP